VRVCMRCPVRVRDGRVCVCMYGPVRMCARVRVRVRDGCVCVRMCGPVRVRDARPRRIMTDRHGDRLIKAVLVGLDCALRTPLGARTGDGLTIADYALLMGLPSLVCALRGYAMPCEDMSDPCWSCCTRVHAHTPYTLAGTCTCT
jgi:hypothetical protein